MVCKRIHFRRRGLFNVQRLRPFPFPIPFPFGFPRPARESCLVGPWISDTSLRLRVRVPPLKRPMPGPPTPPPPPPPPPLLGFLRRKSVDDGLRESFFVVDLVFFTSRSSTTPFSRASWRRRDSRSVLFAVMPRRCERGILASGAKRESLAPRVCRRRSVARWRWVVACLVESWDWESRWDSWSRRCRSRSCLRLRASAVSSAGSLVGLSGPGVWLEDNGLGGFALYRNIRNAHVVFRKKS